MKYSLIILVLIIIGFFVFPGYFSTNKSSVIPIGEKTSKISSELALKSPAFENGGTIPIIYTCDGRDISPPLNIDGVSPDAKSLVLIMSDIDAPNGTWNHWVKFNISPNIKLINEGDESVGISGKGTSGNSAYEGPCPPSGTHRYVFDLYALDVELALSRGASQEEVLGALKNHVIEKTTLMGRFVRSKVLKGSDI